MKKMSILKIYFIINIFLNYSLLSLSKNIKEIRFLQNQIRKYLQSKKKDNKLFNRPQTKSKNNYLYLNSDDMNQIENKNPNINTNINSKYDKEIETQAEIEKNK